MRKLAYLLLILFVANSSLAQCCCTGYPTLLKDKIDSADLVIEAYLVATKPLTYYSGNKKKKSNSNEVLKYVFKAKTIYKGNTDSRIINIYSYTPDQCGAAFIEGKTYIVYALFNDTDAPPAPNADEHYWYTESCRHNSRSNDYIITEIEKVTTAKKR